MSKEAPKVYWRYDGEGLNVYWLNPWEKREELIASFWWPAHPMEETKQVEDWFEGYAEAMTSPLAQAKDAVIAAALAYRNACVAEDWNEVDGCYQEMLDALAALDAETARQGER